MLVASLVKRAALHCKRIAGIKSAKNKEADYL